MSSLQHALCGTQYVCCPAQDVRKQLLQIMDRYRLDLVSAGANYNRIRQAICSGFFFQAARKDPQEARAPPGWPCPPSPTPDAAGAPRRRRPPSASGSWLVLGWVAISTTAQPHPPGHLLRLLLPGRTQGPQEARACCCACLRATPLAVPRRVAELFEGAGVSGPWDHAGEESLYLVPALAPLYPDDDPKA